MIQIKIDDNEIKNKINQIKNNKKLIINKIASILEAETIRLFNLQQDPKKLIKSFNRYTYINLKNN